MDGFDLVMILFFFIFPIALVVSLVLLRRERRAHQAAEAELTALREEASALRERLSALTHADENKNSNHSSWL